MEECVAEVARIREWVRMADVILCVLQRDDPGRRHTDGHPAEGTTGR